jgi:CBS domain-containing protein
MIGHPSTPQTVGEVATGEPIVVAADAPLLDAVELMAHNQVTGLPVVDAGGRLIGVISQTDLIRLRTTHHLWEHWAGLSVRHLMTAPAQTIHGSATLVAAADKMERRHVHRLVVVADDDPARPIGVISTSDLVRAMAEEGRQ